MRENRFGVFLTFAGILNTEGYRAKLYGFELTRLCSDQTTPLKWLVDAGSWVRRFRGKIDGYNSSLFANALDATIEGDVINALRSDLDETPAVIISSGPSAILRKAFPKAAVLHYELGFMNRPPLPIFHRLDPLGFHHQGMLAKFPHFSAATAESQPFEIEKVRETFRKIGGYDPTRKGSIDAVFVPLQSSDNWTSKLESPFNDRFVFLSRLSEIYNGIQIIASEKPQSRLTAEEKESISSLPNVRLIIGESNWGEGSQLAYLCKKTYSYSPSLVLQALFWGNNVEVPPESSMTCWSSYLNESHKNHLLFQYLSLFQFSTKAGFLSRFQALYDNFFLGEFNISDFISRSKLLKFDFQ